MPLAQAGRIAAARGAAPDAVHALIAAEVQGPWLGFIGQARVTC